MEDAYVRFEPNLLKNSSLARAPFTSTRNPRRLRVPRRALRTRGAHSLALERLSSRVDVAAVPPLHVRYQPMAWIPTGMVQPREYRLHPEI